MTRARAGDLTLTQQTQSGRASSEVVSGAGPALADPALADPTRTDPGLGAPALADKAAAENFPVALRLLPRRYRRHLMAVYRFARTVDDAGDLAPRDQRQRLLAELERDLRQLYDGPGGGRVLQPAVRGLAGVIADSQIPIDPFLRLVRANQQDQIVTRYETFADLVGYCELSANPVGRIVLHVFGCYTRQRAERSDQICTGLQIAEHLQDVAEDFRAGRIYLPAADMRSHGCSERDLAGGTAPPQLRRLIAYEAGRVRELLDAGAPLVGTLRGAPRAAVAGYLAGGRATLAAIADADYDVLAATPRPGKRRTARELAMAFGRGR
jgi:squalene synthase HpnC